ncbi:MAG: hypothetical protein M1820_008657 [Bogoriella megaspora]|nr:MAG: hypothetical protein M1820_008657 [Bogoriella megaspora]
MEAFRQRPQFPSRLTKLYSDTKSSCDAVSGCEDVEDAPELLSLHRKCRIQKDRLMTWGLEWTDDKAAAQGNIDNSVANAGLTETVTSVLRNIKDVLDEAEQISRRPSTGSKSSEKGWTKGNVDHSWVLADKARYEDLVKDLTTSIDVLYDLSRARRASLASTINDFPSEKGREASAAALGIPRPTFKSPFDPNLNTSDLTLVNTHNTSTTAATAVSPTDLATAQHDNAGLPLKLDISSLVLPQEAPPPYDGENIGLVPPIRLVGQLKVRHSSNNPWKTDGGKDVTQPVLVEYARFDPIYRDTGVPPPLQRLEFINTLIRGLLSKPSGRVGVLPLLGYFEDANHSRIGLVYHAPQLGATATSSSVGSAQVAESTDDTPTSLLSILRIGQNRGTTPQTLVYQPTLEDRFRLAFNLVSTIARMHQRDIIHGDINSASFVCFKRQQQRRDRRLAYDLRSPYLTAFDVFSDYNIDPPPARSWSPRNIYLHPEGTSRNARTDIDPRTRLDIYGMGLILLEIGLWTPLIDIFKPKYTLGEFKLRLQNIWANRLASKCSSLYMKCVLDCLSAGDTKPLHKSDTMDLHRRILERLRRCCALDDSDQSTGEDEFTVPLQHASTHDGTTGRLHSLLRQDSEQNRPALFPRHSSGHIHDKHDRNPLHLLRHHKDSSNRSHTLSSIPSATYALPLAYAGISSPPLSEEPMDMTSGRVEELQKELAQKEVALTDLRRSYDAVVRGVEIDGPRRYSNLETSSSVLRDIEVHLNLKSKDIVHGAAQTIQNAWRNRRSSQQSTTSKRSSFAEYRHKVTLIQKHFRERQIRRSETTTERSQPRDFEEITEEVRVEAVSTPQPIFEEAQVYSQVQEERREKKKLRIYPVKLSSEHLAEWHQSMGPQLISILERVLRDSPETSSVDLVSIGDSQYTARPTIFVTCSSVAKVKAAINRKFNYDREVFDLKVRRGKIRRSHAKRRPPPPLRSMANSTYEDSDARSANPMHYQRPICGASIGAFCGDKHLPPVSYGGIVVVDGRPYGMSVHHLLDEQSDTDSEDETDNEERNDAPVRSSAPYSDDHFAHIGSAPSLLEVPEDSHPFEISDYSSEEDEDVYFSDDSYDMDLSPLETRPRAPSLTGSVSTVSSSALDNVGDIPGVFPHSENRIPITQPALYDVPSSFFPSDDERDEEHLLSHKLGYVYASSGVRRVPDPKVPSVRHEVDWALFQLDPPRLQPYNLVQGGRICCETQDHSASNTSANALEQELRPRLVDPVNRMSGFDAKQDLYPMQVCGTQEVAGQKVCSFGRTSGLKSGQMGKAMGWVKIWGRKTFSGVWGVHGDFGVGGDSGAWVIETNTGKVCGHVLAHCKEKGVAYICPMDILFDDMKRTLGATKITLPGANEPELAEIAEHGITEHTEAQTISDAEDEDDDGDEADDEYNLSASEWDDDEETAVSDTHIIHENARRKSGSLRLDTQGAAGLGLQFQGLGIRTEPPQKEERVLAHRMRERRMSPPMDYGMPLVGSPITGGPMS